MLSAIVQKLTGQTLLQYLRPRLFAPLGIGEATWEKLSVLVSTPAAMGLKVTTEDIARFGQLYLQQGVWQGQQLVPTAWIAEATAKQVSNGSKPESDWEQGYGYQFWRCRHNAYRGDGAFGQYCIVLPEQDAVLAITSGLGDMQAPLTIIWEKLLPAMGPTPLATDSAGQQALQQKLATLRLAPQAGAASSPLAAQVSGRRYAFATDEQKSDNAELTVIHAVTLDFAENSTTFTLHNSYGQQQICCGYGDWRTGVMTVDRRGPGPVAASGAWVTDDLCYQVLFLPDTLLQHNDLALCR